MLYKILILSCIKLLTTNVIFSQNKVHFFDNVREIEINRYEDVKGTPYLYKEWRFADIIDNNGLIFENVKINYNGYTKNFEIRIDDRFIELNEKFYKRIEIMLSDKKRKDVFLSGVHEKFIEKFILVLFNKNNIMLLKDYEVGISEHEVQNVGKTVTFKKFVPITRYFMVSNDELIPIYLNKKSIRAYFEDKIDLDEFVKQNKIRMNSERDIIKILEYWINQD